MTQTGPHSADSRVAGGGEVDLVAVVAVAVPDSADDESSQHSKQVEVQFVAAATVPKDYSGEPTRAEAEAEEVAVVVVAAAAASGEVAGSIHSDLHFHCWKYCLQMLGGWQLRY